MSHKYSNARKTSFLESIPTASLESTEDPTTDLCKFNFAYFKGDHPGQHFSEWPEPALHELLDKLVHFSKNSLTYWMKQQSGRIFTIYGQFPSKSDFTHPKNVPFEAQWARFRLDSATRLIGFIVPKKFDGTPHRGTKRFFDSNTFYVVFLDAEHRFYITERR